MEWVLEDVFVCGQIVRSFRLTPDGHLHQSVAMETSNTQLSNHLEVVYKKAQLTITDDSADCDDGIECDDISPRTYFVVIQVNCWWLEAMATASVLYCHFTSECA